MHAGPSIGPAVVLRRGRRALKAGGDLQTYCPASAGPPMAGAAAGYSASSRLRRGRTRSRCCSARAPSASCARSSAWPRSIGNAAGTRQLGNNLGTIAPKHRGKRGSRADQKAGRINKIDVPALSAKPPSPVQIRAAPPILFAVVRLGVDQLKLAASALPRTSAAARTSRR